MNEIKKDKEVLLQPYFQQHINQVLLNIFFILLNDRILDLSLFIQYEKSIPKKVFQ
jgi:hypothetical protein